MFNRLVSVNLKSLVKSRLVKGSVLNTSTIKFTNNNSKKENSILNQTQPVTNNNNMTVMMTAKNLFAFKNYSTSTTVLPDQHNSTDQTETLDPAKYDSWTKEQVCSLLTTKKEEGGAGLADDEVKPLYNAGFKGSSLAVIVTYINTFGLKEALSMTSNDYTSIPKPTIATVVFWVENLLKTRLYHLWTADQVRDVLCCPIYKGGAGLSPTNNEEFIQQLSMEWPSLIHKQQSVQQTIKQIETRFGEAKVQTILPWLSSLLTPITIDVFEKLQFSSNVKLGKKIEEIVFREFNIFFGNGIIKDQTDIRKLYPLIQCKLPITNKMSIEMLFADRMSLKMKDESDIIFGSAGSHLNVSSIDSPSFKDGMIGVLVHSRGLGKTKYLLDLCKDGKTVPLYLDCNLSFLKSPIFNSFVNHLKHCVSLDDTTVNDVTTKLVCACIIDFIMFVEYAKRNRDKLGPESSWSETYTKLSFNGSGYSRNHIFNFIINIPSDQIFSFIHEYKPKEYNLVIALDEIQTLKDRDTLFVVGLDKPFKSRISENDEHKTIIHPIISALVSVANLFQAKIMVAGTKLSLTDLIVASSSPFKKEEMVLFNTLSLLSGDDTERAIQHYFPFLHLTPEMKERWNNVRPRPVFQILIQSLIEKSKGISDPKKFEQMFPEIELLCFNKAVALYREWIVGYVQKKGSKTITFTNGTTYLTLQQLLVTLLVRHVSFPKTHQPQFMDINQIKVLFEIGLISISEIQQTTNNLMFTSNDLLAMEAIKQYFSSVGSNILEAYFTHALSISELKGTSLEAMVELFFVLSDGVLFNQPLFRNLMKNSPSIKYFKAKPKRCFKLLTKDEVVKFLLEKPTNTMVKIQDNCSGGDEMFWIEKVKLDTVEYNQLNNIEREYYDNSPEKRLVVIQERNRYVNRISDGLSTVWFSSLQKRTEETTRKLRGKDMNIIEDIVKCDDETINTFSCFTKGSYVQQAFIEAYEIDDSIVTGQVALLVVNKLEYNNFEDIKRKLLQADKSNKGVYIPSVEFTPSRQRVFSFMFLQDLENICMGKRVEDDEPKGQNNLKSITRKSRSAKQQ